MCHTGAQCREAYCAKEVPYDVIKYFRISSTELIWCWGPHGSDGGMVPHVLATPKGETTHTVSCRQLEHAYNMQQHIQEGRAEQIACLCFYSGLKATANLPMILTDQLHQTELHPSQALPFIKGEPVLVKAGKASQVITVGGHDHTFRAGAHHT